MEIHIFMNVIKEIEPEQKFVLVTRDYNEYQISYYYKRYFI